MWDSTVTLQYMPKQYITWWMEAGYRHSDVPYFAGRGGVTPPSLGLQYRRDEWCSRAVRVHERSAVGGFGDLPDAKGRLCLRQPRAAFGFRIFAVAR